MANWYLQNGKDSDVVISTRVRLARNIKNFNFENKCSKDDKKHILEKIEGVLPSIGYDLKLLRLKDMDNLTKQSLVEKHIISPEFASSKDENCAILINDEENICIMINEEDHLRMQLFGEGIAIEELMNLAIEIDQKLERLVDYAFSEKYGYLTACPTNVGTGLRVSVMVHLPGLAETGNLNKILHIVNNFGMSVRGVYGEGSQSMGNMYQISNNQTLGLTEQEIVKNMKLITDKIIEQERVARKYLGKNQIGLADKVYRAFGILENARILSSNECIDLLSDVKLGTDLGIITIDPEVIAKYAGTVAVECFGIVGMAAVNMKDGLVHLLKKESLTRGIHVNISDDNHISIDFHIIVAYGVSISAVTDNLISDVKYRVEEFSGMQVDKINVYIEGVRVID